MQPTRGRITRVRPSPCRQLAREMGRCRLVRCRNVVGRRRLCRPSRTAGPTAPTRPATAPAARCHGHRAACDSAIDQNRDQQQAARRWAACRPCSPMAPFDPDPARFHPEVRTSTPGCRREMADRAGRKIAKATEDCREISLGPSGPAITAASQCYRLSNNGPP